MDSSYAAWQESNIQQLNSEGIDGKAVQKRSEEICEARRGQRIIEVCDDKLGVIRGYREGDMRTEGVLDVYKRRGRVSSRRGYVTIGSPSSRNHAKDAR